MKEKWKPIANYEKLYEISNYGRIKRIKDAWGRKCDRILSPKIKKNNYTQIGLCKNGEVKYIRIHKLVMICFVGERPKNLEIRHLDGNKLNNRLDNLCYGTKSENAKDSVRHGTNNVNDIKGTKNPKNKLSEKDVLEILNFISINSLTTKQIAKKFNVTTGTIYHLKNKRTWKYISEQNNNI